MFPEVPQYSGKTSLYSLVIKKLYSYPFKLDENDWLLSLKQLHLDAMFGVERPEAPEIFSPFLSALNDQLYSSGQKSDADKTLVIVSRYLGNSCHWAPPSLRFSTYDDVRPPTYLNYLQYYSQLDSDLRILSNKQDEIAKKIVGFICDSRPLHSSKFSFADIETFRSDRTASIDRVKSHLKMIADCYKEHSVLPNLLCSFKKNQLVPLLGFEKDVKLDWSNRLLDLDFDLLHSVESVESGIKHVQVSLGIEDSAIECLNKVEWKDIQKATDLTFNILNHYERMVVSKLRSEFKLTFAQSEHFEHLESWLNMFPKAPELCIAKQPLFVEASRRNSTHPRSNTEHSKYKNVTYGDLKASNLLGLCCARSFVFDKLVESPLMRYISDSRGAFISYQKELQIFALYLWSSYPHAPPSLSLNRVDDSKTVDFLGYWNYYVQLENDLKYISTNLSFVDKVVDHLCKNRSFDMTLGNFDLNETDIKYFCDSRSTTAIIMMHLRDIGISLNRYSLVPDSFTKFKTGQLMPAISLFSASESSLDQLEEDQKIDLLPSKTMTSLKNMLEKYKDVAKDYPFDSNEQEVIKQLNDIDWKGDIGKTVHGQLSLIKAYEMASILMLKQLPNVSAEDIQTLDELEKWLL